jgi:Protein of unknown function DUF262/Protein of unknown function (DUF1524)
VASSEIVFDREGIANLLHTGLFNVPKYQREFKWEEDHVRELFDDIENAIVDQQPEYFLGSIVVSKTASDRPDIVDGQQRLASISILLASMRDYYVGINDLENAFFIENRFLLDKNPVTKDVTPRLRLGDADNEFFEKAILGRPGTPERTFKAQQNSHHRMEAARKRADSYVQKMVSSGNKPDEQIFSRVTFLEKSARIIIVRVPDEVSAFVIFETLNDRGLTLATTDLIKNYLFGKAGAKLGEVQHRWITMNSTIAAAKDEEAVMDYVRHQWSATYGLTREKELFTDIRQKIKNANTSLTYATKLATDARVYAAMLNTELDFWNNYGVTAKQHMQAIELIGVDRMRPLVLATLSKFSISEAKKALQLFVAWSVRFLITSTNWGTLEKQFSEKANQISVGLITDGKSLRAAMKSYIPVDSDFEIEFGTASVSNAISRYLLHVLERSVAGIKQPELIANANPDEVSLEHILPKNPSPGTWSAFEPETASVWARKLGNLCLLASDENGAATNAEFSAKKPTYAKSNLKLTSEVATCSTWDSKSIQERQKKLAKIALKTWPA